MVEKQATSKTVTALKAAGIAARDYSRPVPGGAFLISVDRKKEAGEILLNEGNAKIACYVDPKFRQAVLHVLERDRKITRTVTSKHYGREKPSRSWATDELRACFPVRVQGDVDWQYEDVRIEKSSVDDYDYSLRRKVKTFSYWKISGKVTAVIESRDKHDFLVGMDETAHFIAALPQPVKSVAEAHEVLKPREAEERAEARQINRRAKPLRQGEWFFRPVSASLQRKLTEYVKLNPGQVSARRLEFESSHVAKQCVRLHRLTGGIPAGTYAIGLILDRRAGHHEPLLLDRWHRVDRNREKTFSSSELQNSRIVERRRRNTWD